MKKSETNKMLTDGLLYSVSNTNLIAISPAPFIIFGICKFPDALMAASAKIILKEK